MGLFDFWKKKTPVITSVVDPNFSILRVLEPKLLEKGHQVEWHKQYIALIIDGELEIACLQLDNPGNPQVLHLMISTTHPQYFPDAIIENVAGFGVSLTDQANATWHNYLTSTFDTILYGLNDTHDPNLDFTANDVLWHPKVGAFISLGQWPEYPAEDHFFQLLKSQIPPKLTNKINWLKIYSYKNTSGEIIAECLFNNNHWQEGYEIIHAYAQSWQMPGEYHALKQFIIFLRCDAYD